MVTMKMIAESCGVSTATVSKAFNNAPDISRGTVDRIRREAARLGYMPNAAARALKTRHSRNIGILTEMHDRYGRTHEFISRIISSIQINAQHRGYDITFISSEISGMTMSYLAHCQYRNFDGVAIVCCGNPAPEVEEVVNSTIPCVSVDNCFDCRNAGSVYTDNERAVREMVDYVVSRGHRRIAYIAGEDLMVTNIRQNAFRKACEQHGLSLPDAYFRHSFFHDPAECAKQTAELISLPEPPTCIFYPDDFACIGGLNILEERGLRVPEDVSVVGFDGISLAYALRPRLTTFHQDSDRMGVEVVRMLCEAIETPDTYVPTTIAIPGKLILGETVANLLP